MTEKKEMRLDRIGKAQLFQLNLNGDMLLFYRKDLVGVAPSKYTYKQVKQEIKPHVMRKIQGHWKAGFHIISAGFPAMFMKYLTAEILYG